MPLPALGIGLFPQWSLGIAYNLADYALGKPLEYLSNEASISQQPALRNASYSVNRTRPNVLPSPEAIIRAHRAGLLSDSVAANACKFQGVDYPMRIVNNRSANLGDGSWAHLWSNIALTTVTRPDPITLAKLYQRGRLTLQEYTTLGQHTDADWGKLLDVVSASYDIPDVSVILSWYRRGLIDEAQFRLYLRQIGYTNRGIVDRILADPNDYSTAELFALNLRRKMPIAELRTRLTSQGWIKPDDRDRLMELRNQIPGPADLVRFAVKEVWDNEVVQRFGYDDEFPGAFRYWMHAQGYDWQEDAQDEQGNVIPGVNWAKAYWRSHWQTIAPFQGYEMVRRLRPENLPALRQELPNLRAFTRDDLASVLKIADYPPAVRDWLQAIAFTPLDRRTLSQVVRIGSESTDWMVEHYRDLGLTRSDATTTVRTLRAQALIQQMKPLIIGHALQQPQAEARLTAIGLSPESAQAHIASIIELRDLKDQAWLNNERGRISPDRVHQLRENYLAGLLGSADAATQLVAMGFRQQEALALVSNWALEFNRESAKVYLRAMERDFLQGAMSIQEAITRLTAAPVSVTLGTEQGATTFSQTIPGLGLSTEAATALMQRWIAERSLERRQGTWQNIQQWVKDGLITKEEGVMRLTNLGYIQPDATLMVAHVVKGAERSEQAVANKIGALRQRQAKELEAAQKQALKAAKDAQAELRRLTPLATIRKWVKDKTVSAAWALVRLQAIGYPEDVATTYLKDWGALPEAPQLPPQSPPPPPPPDHLTQEAGSIP